MNTGVQTPTEVTKSISTTGNFSITGLGSSPASSIEFLSGNRVQVIRPIVGGAIDSFFANLVKNNVTIPTVTITLFQGGKTIRTIVLTSVSLEEFSPVATPGLGSHVSEAAGLWEAATFSFNTREIADAIVTSGSSSVATEGVTS